MIELVDDALEAWLSATVDGAQVTFEPPVTASGGKGKPKLHLFLHAMKEKDRGRGGFVDDLRNDESVVTARQRSIRYFSFDYLVTASGEPRAQHQALGAFLQALVDVDALPREYLSGSLAEIELPVEVETIAPEGAVDIFGSLEVGSRASAGLRVTAPIVPTPDTDIGAPVTELELDMAPHPEAPVRDPETGVPESVPDHIHRRWTSVRVREFEAKAAD